MRAYWAIVLLLLAYNIQRADDAGYYQGEDEGGGEGVTGGNRKDMKNNASHAMRYLLG